MILTRTEQKSVLRMVIESYQGITLAEAKSNPDIKKKMKLNLKFYNEVKKGFLNEDKSNILEAEGILSSILSVIGNIKNFITSTKLGKNVVEWVKNFITKFVEKFKNVIINYIPGGETILKGAKYITEAIGKFFKWIYNTITEKGLAKLFAMVRYRTFSPTEEQKNCMLLAAKKAYKWILITLVAAFIIKILIVAVPLLFKAGVAIKVGLPLATTFAPFKAILFNLGFKSIFSTYSTITKVDQAEKLEKEIESEEATAKAGELDSFNEAWNKCPLPSYISTLLSLNPALQPGFKYTDAQIAAWDSKPINTPFDPDDYYNT
jgi:hypothetical protein